MSRLAKRLLAALGLLPALLLSGCWDYMGLDEMSIVSGLSIDISESDVGRYALSFEIIDALASSEPGQTGSKLIHSEGRSVFEAVSRANDQLHSKLYFGNMEVVVVSERLAAERGIGPIVSALMRDFSTREKLIIVVARTEEPEEIITPPEGEEGTIISRSIDKTINEDTYSLNATRPLQLYQIYNRLALGADNLALPAFRTVDTGDGAATLTLDGMAVFRGDRLAGFLENEETKVFLYLVDHLQNGTFVFYLDEAHGNELGVTLQIRDSVPTLGYRWEDGRLTLTASVDIQASARELAPAIQVLSQKDVDALEDAAAQALEHKITDVVRQAQQGDGVDIFGFGDRIYRLNPRLWEALKDDWEAQFRTAEVDISCHVLIQDIGMVKRFE